MRPIARRLPSLGLPRTTQIRVPATTRSFCTAPTPACTFPPGARGRSSENTKRCHDLRRIFRAVGFLRGLTAHLKILGSLVFDNAALLQLLGSVHLPRFLSLTNKKKMNRKKKGATHKWHAVRKLKPSCVHRISLPSQKPSAWFCIGVLLRQECCTWHCLHSQSHIYKSGKKQNRIITLGMRVRSKERQHCKR